MTDVDRAAELQESYSEDGPGGAEESVGEQADKPARRSVSAQLVDMALRHHRLGVTDADEPFGVSREHPHIAMMLRGGKTGLRAELARRYFAETNTVASQQALADACLVLEGRPPSSRHSVCFCGWPKPTTPPMWIWATRRAASLKSVAVAGVSPPPRRSCFAGPS